MLSGADCDRFAAVRAPAANVTRGTGRSPLQVRVVSRVLLVVGLFVACSAEGKPTPGSVVAEPATPALRWVRAAEELIAFADRAKDQETRSLAIREIGAFADRAPPANSTPPNIAEMRQRLYARAAQLAFDSEAPERALRLATRGLKASAEGESRMALLALVVRAKRTLGDEAGAVELERELEVSAQ